MAYYSLSLSKNSIFHVKIWYQILVASFLSFLHQLMKKEDLEDDFLGCTPEDLLRFDDYNNDGYLTLQELNTAFRKYQYHWVYF